MGGLNIKLPSDHESYLEWSMETSLVLESQDPVTAVTKQENLGGYTHVRYNEIRDTIANLMNEVCHDVEIEPKLQPLQDESFVKI